MCELTCLLAILSIAVMVNRFSPSFLYASLPISMSAMRPHVIDTTQTLVMYGVSTYIRSRGVVPFLEMFTEQDIAYMKRKIP